MKLATIVMSLLVLPFLANAADKSSGCGLGWKVVSDTSLISSYTRSITNALTSSTFGMTSGTSGCASHSIVKKDEEAAKYAFTNFDSLKSEISVGQGEALAGLGRVMGCNDASISEFSQSVKTNFEKVLPAANTGAGEMFHNIKGVIQGNANLSNNCVI